MPLLVVETPHAGLESDARWVAEWILIDQGRAENIRWIAEVLSFACGFPGRCFLICIPCCCFSQALIQRERR